MAGDVGQCLRCGEPGELFKVGLDSVLNTQLCDVCSSAMLECEHADKRVFNVEGEDGKTHRVARCKRCGFDEHLENA